MVEFRSWSPRLLLLLLTTALPAQGGVVTEKAGKHFRVVLHRGDLDGELATKIVAQAHIELARLMGVVDQMLAPRISEVRTIHLYRDVQQYLAVEKGQSPFGFSTNRAEPEAPRTHLLGNGFVGKDGQGHLRLVPHFPVAMLAEVGLPHPTLVTLLRVGAELVIGPLVNDQDPQGFLRWVLVMGAALAATNPTHQFGVDAAFDHRRSIIISRRSRGDEVTLESIIAGTTQWPLRWQWESAMVDFEVLAQHLSTTDANWARKLVKEWSRSSKERTEMARRKKAVSAVVGADWRAASARFAELVDGFDPEWTVFRDMWMPGKRALLAGTVHVGAGVRHERTVEGDYSVSARVELGGGEPRPLMIHLSFQEGGLIAWYHVGAVGFCFLNDKMQYENLAEARVGIEQGKPFDTRVELRGAEARLFVDGELRCSCKHGFQTSRGDVSFMINERLVWLEDMKVEPLPANAKK